MAGYPGVQGRKPKPSTIAEKQKERRGNKTIPHPPEYLSDEAKECWKRLIKVLKGAGLIERADADALAMYCKAYERWLEAEENIKKFGMVTESRNGFPIVSPFVSVADKSMAQMMRLLTEFGMTPASRSRIPQGKSELKREAPAHKWDKVDPREVLGNLN